MANDLISSLKSWAKQYDKPWKDDYAKGFRAGVFAAIEAVKELDATPVVHGRWVNSDIDGILTCSNCKGCGTTSDYLMDTGFSFCPNCGAKMYGGEEDVAD